MKSSDNEVMDDRSKSYQEIARENSRLADHNRWLVRLTQAVNKQCDLQSVMRVIRDIFVEECGFDRAGTFSYDPITETMQGWWGTDANGEIEDNSPFHFAFDGPGRDLWEQLKGGGPGFSLRHFEPDEERGDLPEDMSNVQDQALIYLCAAGELVGYVSIDNLLTNRPIMESQIVELMPFIEQASHAIFTTKLRSDRESAIRRQKRVTEISLAITSNEDPEMVFRMVRKAIMEVGFLDRAAVWVVEDFTAYGTWSTDEYGELRDEHDVTFPVEPGGKYFTQFDNPDEPFVIDTVKVIGRNGELWDNVAHAYIPLRVGTELFGIVTVDNMFSGHRIMPTMLSLVLPIADQAAVVIQRARLKAQQEAVVRQQRQIMEIAVAITANTDPDSVFRMVRDAILATGSVDRVGVWIVEDGVAIGTWGTDSDGNLRDEHHIRFPIDSFVQRYSECLVGSDEYVIDYSKSVTLLSGERVSNVPFAVMPIRAGNHLVGILTLDTLMTRRKLTREKLELILPLAKQAAVVVQNSRLLNAAEREIERRREAEELLKAHADELTIARDAALAGTRVKSEFLANMSHEIRTPMNGVIGMTSMLMQTPLSTEQYGYARVIQESAGSLLSVIEDILDFSRLEAGMLKINRSPFSLRHCIEDIAELMSSQVGDGSVELNCFVPPDFPELIVGDGDRVRQMVTNLMGNAIKFTPQGEVTLLITCLAETEEEAIVRIEVRDTGIGIADDQQDSIFESFTQVDGSSTRLHGGAGLGLTITKQIAKLLGGSIHLESRLGEGSRFWLDIPFEKQKGSDSGNASSGPLSGATVLVAIGNDTNRGFLTKYLSHWGCINECACTLAEAVAIASSRAPASPFDFLIIDHEMQSSSQFPVLSKVSISQQEDRTPSDGVEMLADLRDVPSTEHSHAILLTSAFNRHQSDALFYVDFATVIAKPVRGAHLRNVMEKMITGQPSIASHTSLEKGQEVRLGLRVLLAEDNGVNSMVATGRLEKWGCTCLAVETGVEVLESLESDCFDVVLMDVSMPVMDGIQATLQIRQLEAKRGGHIPIIAMTAHALEGDRDRCVAAGMDDYVAKPINFDELLIKLRRWNGLRSRA